MTDTPQTPALERAVLLGVTILVGGLAAYAAVESIRTARKHRDMLEAIVASVQLGAEFGGRLNKVPEPPGGDDDDAPPGP